jgi:hypothetical protein
LGCGGAGVGRLTTGGAVGVSPPSELCAAPSREDVAIADKSTAAMTAQDRPACIRII